MNNNTPDVKENDENVLDFCSSSVSPLSVSVSFNFPCTAHAFFPERLSNHFQGLRRTFSEICAKCDAVPLSDPSRNHIRPDIRFQINGRKISTSTQLREILYTYSKYMLLLLPLHRTTKNAVLSAASVPEIMDAIS
jgi:hypothetical protein